VVTVQKPSEVDEEIATTKQEMVATAGQPESAQGHAADYSWLVGELQYVHIRDVWRLRYASTEDEDKYGGSVTLVDTDSITGFCNGERVRVVGHLIDPHSREPSPSYRVMSIQVHPTP
jgi:hypothetical protein